MGTTKGTSKDTGIEKEINELRHEWAQLRAQLGAQPMNSNLPQSELLQKSGHTEGTNTKKEEREYIDISLHQKKENTPDGVSKKAKLSSPSPSEKIDYSGLMEYYNTTFKEKGCKSPDSPIWERVSEECFQSHSSIPVLTWS